jgi:hypothetical protein
MLSQLHTMHNTERVVKMVMNDQHVDFEERDSEVVTRPRNQGP